jgi:hypothetical protein
LNAPWWVDVAGWTAMILILAAYWLLSTGRLSSTTPLYQWMNIVGAAGFVINSGWNNAIPSAVLNVLWMGIGLWALWRIRVSR